jgi:ribonuclease P protein component
MRDSADFRSTVRRGVRVGRPTVVVHAHHTAHDGVRVGIVVSKAVGGSVTRNAVKRRLRHLAVGCLAATPAGTDVVLRALPRAATTPLELRGDLPSAWQSALRRLTTRAGAE